MKRIKIEKINLPDKKGIGWIVILGLFPIVGPFLELAILLIYESFGTRLKRTPFFRLSNNKTLGKTKSWGIFFFFIAIVYAILITLFIDNFLILPLRIYLFLPFSTLAISLYLITYNKRYNNYIKYVNDFLNDLMLKKQLNNNFNSSTILKYQKKNDRKMKNMLVDLKRNNIISIQNGKDSDEKIICFTPDFQQILLSE